MRLLAALAFALLALAAPRAATAAPWDPLRWHDPVLMASVDEAANAVTNARPFVREQHQYPSADSISPLYFVDRFIIERDGIGFVSSRNETRTTTQWVPSWGGSWVGGRYVPYSGGSSVVTQTPERKEATIWFAYSDVQMLILMQWTKDNPDNPWPWCLTVMLQAPAGDIAPKTVAFCAQRADQTHKMFDALFTLIAASGKSVLRFWQHAGAAYSDPDVDVPRRMRDLGWQKGGYLVAFVIPGSPAEAAGLQKDDIVTEANGAPVAGTDDFTGQIHTAAQRGAPYGTLDIKVFRNGQEFPTRLTNLHEPYHGLERLKSPPPPAAPH